jgi:Transglycosylase SLT domain
MRSLLQPLRRGVRPAFLCLLFSLGMAGVSSAELVFLSTGRALTVRSHRLEGDRLVLVLVDGGEVTCPPSQVARIEPDEVPIRDRNVPPADIAPDASAPYKEMIERSAAREGVDPRLVRAVIQVESAYQPAARSRKGAAGLMQLMPETARRYAVRNPYDPDSNISAGIKYLKTLLDRYELPLALAAYNAGEAAVERFGGIPPFPETQNYVRQILRLLGGAAQR